MLDQVRIVLVNPSHPGNIGAAARAMKTMGLSELYLVSPAAFPHPKANEMAASATDILAAAKIVGCLDQAISDCTLVVGTSARSRKIPWPLYAPRDMAEKVKSLSPVGQTAILFGQEQSGLSNDELQRCHVHVQIPTSAAYSSLNLAAAVQIISYELRVASNMSMCPAEPVEHWDYRLATAGEMEGFFTHLQQVLIDLDFLKINAPRQLMTRLRRLFCRTQLDVMEMNILRGVLTAIQNKKNFS